MRHPLVIGLAAAVLAGCGAAAVDGPEDVLERVDNGGTARVTYEWHFDGSVAQSAGVVNFETGGSRFATDEGLAAALAPEQLGLRAFVARWPTALEFVNRVVEIGTETVSGVSTRHYRGDMDPAAFISASYGSGPVPVDAWVEVGSFGARVLRITFGESPSSSEALGQVELTIEYYDFGVAPEADIEARSSPADPPERGGRSG